MTRAKLTDEERARRAAARKASATGRKARRAGDDAEMLVLRAAERYAVTHAARLWRCGKRPRFAARGDVGTPVDFAGYLPGGRAMLAEVKSTSGTRLRTTTRGAATVTDSEAQALEAAHDAGAMAVLIIRTPAGWWRIGWDEWDGLVTTQGGLASVSARDLDCYGTRLPVVDGLPMYLDGLLMEDL
jgi:hypothetical protein